MKTKINEKPLVDMTPAELQETFDEIGKPGNRAMLEDARNHKDQDILLALGYLTRPNGDKVLVISDNEYGDGEGIRFVDEWIDEINRCGLLERGEALGRVVVKVTQFEVVPELEPAPGNVASA